MKRKIIIAIDGFSGTGKSSTAKSVAKQLGYQYIDSGAMYRAVTHYFKQLAISLTDMTAINNALADLSIKFEVNGASGESEVLLNGVRVESQIRTQAISESVSTVAAITEVRQKLVQLQQGYGVHRGVVMDGRDIGTVVFPDAELKVFMMADVSIRAKRRYDELQAKGIAADIGAIEANLMERDRLDSTREDSPLTKAKDVVEIDTTHLTFDDQVYKIVTFAEQLIDA